MDEYEDEETGLIIKEKDEEVEINKKETSPPPIYISYSSKSSDWFRMGEENITIPYDKNHNILVGKRHKTPQLVIGDKKEQDGVKIKLPDEIPERIEIWRNTNDLEIIDELEDSDRIEINNNILTLKNIIKGEIYTIGLQFSEMKISIKDISTKLDSTFVNIKGYVKKDSIKIKIPEKINSGFLTLIENQKKSLREVTKISEKNEYIIESKIQNIERSVEEINEKTHIETKETLILESGKHAPILKEVKGDMIEFKEEELERLSKIDVTSNINGLMDLYKISITYKTKPSSINSLIFYSQDFKYNYFKIDSNKVIRCVPNVNIQVKIESDYLQDKHTMKIKLSPGEKRNIEIIPPKDIERDLKVDIFIKSENEKDFIIETSGRKYQQASNKTKNYRIQDRNSKIIIRNIKLEKIKELDFSDKLNISNVYFDYDKYKKRENNK